MLKVENQKIKLQQKKNRLIAEETRLNLKERKMRTRYLIEIGGLIVKAKLDHLPTNTLYGALLSLKNSLDEDSNFIEQWTKLGKQSFDKEDKSKHAVILTTSEIPTIEVRTHLRTQGLKWNKLRKEWYGYVTDLDYLRSQLHGTKFDLELIT